MGSLGGPGSDRRAEAAAARAGRLRPTSGAAGRLDLGQLEDPVRRCQDEQPICSADRTRSDGPRGRATRAPPGWRDGPGRSRSQIRATAGTPAPAARGQAAGCEGSSRPSSRRSGRVSVAPAGGCGTGTSDAGAVHAGSERRSRSARALRERGLEVRRRLVAAAARPRRRRRSGRCRGPSSMPHQRRRPSRCRRRGSWPGSATRPRWRGSSDGCRFSAPSGTLEQRRRARSGRSRRGRSGPATGRGPSATASGRRRRSGARTGPTPSESAAVTPTGDVRSVPHVGRRVAAGR